MGLRGRAKRRGRLLDATVREVPRRAVTKARAEFFKAADAMRTRLAGRHHTETVDLLRQDRDR
jgi:hypothetical protein